MKGLTLKLNKWAAAAVLALMLALASFNGVSGASGQAGQCDGYNDPANVKIDTSDDDLVLPAGLLACIHAGGENTGQFTTDGVLTLGGYIIEFGLLNNGGQVPGVSNYVIYGEAQPSVTPTEPTSTSTPTAEPSATPTSTPTVEPSASPTESPVSSASPSAPTPTSTPTSRQPQPTQPNTAAGQDVPEDVANSPIIPWLIGIIAAIWLFANWGSGRTGAKRQ